jgi:hypothetical protein
MLRLIKILFLQESGDYVEKEERVVGCGQMKHRFSIQYIFFSEIYTL